MLDIITVGFAAIILMALAILMALILGWANRKFHVEVDPRVEEIMDALPQANCGACGYVGCSEYAEAVAKGEADVDLCAPGGESCAKNLAEIMGVELEEMFPYRPVVHCAANEDQRLQMKVYQGEQTCTAANLVSGVQGCTYGCLGFGDCVRSCNYDAIHLKKRLAVVDYDKCVGCGACARVCPRNIITMVPFKASKVPVIQCSNKDFGPEVKKVCKVGCIGCGICARFSDLIFMEDNLPRIKYEEYEPDKSMEKPMEKCPMKKLVYIGKPTREEKNAVTDEEIPDRIEADFKTTVDKTEWWG